MQRIKGWVLGMIVVICARPLPGQSPRLPEVEAFAPGFTSPAVRQQVALPRHAHVRDGALVGAGVGSLAGGLIGMFRYRQVCPQRALVCQGMVGMQYASLVGVGIGGLVGGVTGGVVGAFVRTTGGPGRTAAGVTIDF